MRIAIHDGKTAYSKRWVEYCIENDLDYLLVNAYSDNIVEELLECDVFMWHHHHANYKDVVFAKQLLYAIESIGIKVFPNFNSGWHFDDKLGQKYLFEANQIPAAKAWVFFDKESAYSWVESTNFPKIFKLRGGAGSSNVLMIKSKRQAKKIIRKSFGKGFKAFNYFALAKDKFKLFLKGRATIYNIFKYIGLHFFPFLNNSHLLPKQCGYVYFQEFIPNDGYDIRVEITGDKALALTRMTREGDFRASGSNNVIYDTDLINKEVIDFAFGVADKLQLQSCALDIVRDNRDNKLYIIENSYCYGVDEDEFDHGYWTRDGIHHKNVVFNGLDWILENIIK